MPRSEPPARAQRRTSGARVEASERITLRAPNFETQGWTLNVGRGGVRVVLEERIEDGREYELFFSDDNSGRRVQVAWVQDAADGQIAGLKYLDPELGAGSEAGGSTASTGSVPPPGRSDPPAGE
jgi:hypothetical protein